MNDMGIDTTTATARRVVARRSALLAAVVSTIALLAPATAGADVLDSISAPTLISVPVSPTNSKSASIEFVGDPGNLFDCWVDYPAFKPCTSPLELSDLADGTHTIVVRQRTPQGDVGAEVAVASWDVDTVPPLYPGIRSNRTGVTAATTATITLTGDGFSTFMCSVDGADAEECDSPLELTDLADGDHTVSATQVDAAGNESTSRSVSWTVDTTPPDAPTVTSNRSGLVNQRSASVSFSGEFGGSFRCKVDSAASFTACPPSPLNLSGLADGDHSVAVKQIDRAGNVSDEASVSWTVDATAPAQPTVSVNRSGTTNLRTATATFSGESDASFECGLDAGPLDACTSPMDYVDLSIGTHRFKIRQIDLAGNPSAWKYVDWTVAAVTVARQPTISGGSPTGLAIGTSLSASGEQFTGSSGQASLTLQWQRCPDSGLGTCTDIAGANGRTYTVAADDGGSRLRFTATHLSTEGSSATALSSQTAVVLPDVVTPPEVTPTGNLDSAFGYGRTLGFTGLTWRGLPSDAPLRYRWDRCLTSSPSSCRPIALTGNETVVPGAFEVGRRVRVSVGASVGGKVVWTTSALSPIIRVRGLNTDLPQLVLSIDGDSPVVGVPVTVAPGSWTYRWAGKLTYRWQACTSDSAASCYSISLTSKAWSPRSNFVGKRLRVLETYTGHDGTKVTAASAITGPILAG